MIEAPLPPNESLRLAALHELNILDTPPEERFDRMTRIAAATFDVPIAFVSLIDSERQWFKSVCGLSVEGTPRSLSFCSHAILHDEPLIVADAHDDERFADNPLVTGDPHIRFYAGHPLRTVDGYKIGTLCLADRVPRRLTEEEIGMLGDMAMSVQDQLNLVEIAHLQAELRTAEEKLREVNADLERSNKLIRNVFGRYVTDDVARVILQSAETLRLGGEVRHVTLLICDIRGYTTVSEKLPAEQVMRLLNRFLGSMIDLIIEFGGTVDQILGDGILAIFGAPLDLEGRSRSAVACALEMQAAMEAINAENARDGLPKLECGIGINSGPVVVGNIGSEKRMKYSVIGNAVNLAARIESQCRGGQVLVSEAVRGEVGNDLQIGGETEVRVKGFEEPVTLFDVGGLRGPQPERFPHRLAHEAARQRDGGAWDRGGTS